MYLNCFVNDKCIMFSRCHEQSQHHILKMTTQLSLQLFDKVLQEKMNGPRSPPNNAKNKLFFNIIHVYVYSIAKTERIHYCF